MKISPKQILASAVGATLAAVVASFFGVKGTIIGVAIGSAVATTVSALMAQSIERTHLVVQQAAERYPDRVPVLRRLGETRSTASVGNQQAESTPAGVATVEPGMATVEQVTTASEACATTGVIGDAAATGPVVDEEPIQAIDVTSATATGAVPLETPTLAQSTQIPAPTAEIVTASIDRTGEAITQVRSVPIAETPRTRTLWPIVALAVVGVFALSLGIVTGVEVIAGRPLASLFGVHGSAGSGTSIGQTFSPSPTTTTSTTATSTTTTSTSTSTSTSTTSTTTPSSTTTTTGPGSTTTTIKGGGSTTTSPGSTSTTTPASTTTTSTVGA